MNVLEIIGGGSCCCCCYYVKVKSTPSLDLALGVWQLSTIPPDEAYPELSAELSDER